MKIGKVDAAQRRAVDALQIVERRLIAGDDQEEIEQLIGVLQQRLSDWQLLCQLATTGKQHKMPIFGQAADRSRRNSK